MKFSLPKAPTGPPPEIPKNSFGKILTSTPVIMTVISTLMAGLSNSEMTRGQYERSMAAQLQSKAADQWSFYQAKRLRSTSLRASEAVLRATADTGPISVEKIRGMAPASVSATNLDAALDAIAHARLPTYKPQNTPFTNLQPALTAIAEGKSDRELLPILASVPEEDVEAALLSCQADARGFDHLVAPLGGALDQVERTLSDRLEKEAGTLRPIWRDFTAARMVFDSLRYEAEARFNRPVADLLELQVRLFNRDAEHHRARSERFFYGMLASQLAVMIATLSLALQKRNIVWAVAASIGLTAVGFGVYVYLYV